MRALTLACLASLAFAGLGLPDGLLGIAWASLRASFALPLDALGALLAAFTAGYVGASFAGGRLSARWGIGTLLAASCAVTALSLFGYAVAPTWEMVVALAALAGLGAGGIDTGINGWAAERHGPGMLSWLHACYGVGAAGGPAIMTAVLSAALPWQRGYAIVGSAQLALAIAFACTVRAWRAPPAHGFASRAVETAIAATLRVPAARWSMILFFAYTGLELATSVFAYTVLTEGRGVPMQSAAAAVTGYWIGLTAGRLLAAFALRAVRVATLLRGSLAGLTLGLAVFAVRIAPATDVAALLLAGTAAGPIFPSLIANTKDRVGVAHARNALGFQIAAAAMGQALVPALLGAVGRHFGLDALTTGLAAIALAVTFGFARSQRRAHGEARWQRTC